MSRKTKIFDSNIERDTERNRAYRRVIYTGEHIQIVLMSIPAGQDVHMEIHPHTDQFVRIEKGQGVALIGKNEQERHKLKAGSAILIPANTHHRIVNTSKTQPLQLYTLYSPPEHRPNELEWRRPRD